MRVGIMGAGAIGCYVGGRLACAPPELVKEVVLVGRKSIADEISEHGLKLTRYDGHEATVPRDRLRVVTSAGELADFDVVIVTVKGGDTVSAGKELAPVLQHAVVVSLQNGVRNATLLGRELPKLDAAHRVVPAMVPFNVLRAGNGRFHQGTSGRIALGKAHSGAADTGGTLQSLVDAWHASGVSARVVDDIAAIQWGKLLINLNNAVNALAGVPIQTMIKDRGYRFVMGAVLDEAVRVLAAARVKTILEPPVPAGVVASILRMPDSLFGFVAPRIIKVDPEARSSMWDDLQRKRRTEIDALNGEIVGLAKERGIAAPVNEAIVMLVKEAETKAAGSPCMSSSDLRARVGV